jgi:seryl-tRNA synthetase
MSRVPIALIENHQDEQGQVRIPSSLQPYMHGQSAL